MTLSIVQSIRKKLPLEHETALFIMANACDIFMTWIMLHYRFVESNELAEYFILNWGLAGMVVFKLSIVTFVCLIAQYIAVTKVDTARWLLRTGALITAGVVIYSFVMAVQNIELLGMTPQPVRVEILQ